MVAVLPAFAEPQHFSLGETLLFVALAAATAYAFWRRFGPILGNPKTVILGLRGYLNEFGPASEEPLLGKYNAQQAAFECATCGACEFRCPVGVEHVPIIVGLRRGAVNTGAWDDSYGAKFFLALEKSSNAFGLPAAERDKFIEKNTLPIFDGAQEYCLWLGCMGAYDPRGRDVLLALVCIMRHLGLSFGVLHKEKCTGDPVRRLGNDLLFQQLAEFNLATLSQSKTKKIMSICPHCVRTMQEDWKAYGTPPEVEHHSEFLARHLNESLVSGSPPKDNRRSFDSVPLTRDFAQDDKQASRNEKVVFHDPCYLGRYRNVYDEPRRVAVLAGDLVEAPRSRERSFCCGAGGGLTFLGEEKGERVSQVRTVELTATGPAIVAAACPFCNTIFRDALATRGEDAPKLLDIAQIAARRLLGAAS